MSNNNNKNMNGFDRFRDRHPILFNSVLMVATLIALGYIALLFIDVFTSHGQQVQVPDVRNLPLEKAIDILDDAGLRWEISDSTTFYENYPPGTIIDQDPKAMLPSFRFPSWLTCLAVKEWQHCALWALNMSLWTVFPAKWAA